MLPQEEGPPMETAEMIFQDMIFQDMMQPILPSVDSSLGEQSQMEMAEMIVHDLPARDLASFEHTGSMINIHNTPQPSPSAQACESGERQFWTSTNMARIHETCHPISSAEFDHSSTRHFQNASQSTPEEKQGSIRTTQCSPIRRPVCAA